MKLGFERVGRGTQVSLTFHDRAFLTPLAKRPKKAPEARPDTRQNDDIGRSPRFEPGWWLMAAALFYIAVALVLIFAQ
jgi:hypothetical protein